VTDVFRSGNPLISWPWPFWLRRNSDRDDWSHGRPTSNHFGIALAMRIVEDIMQWQTLPLQGNRIKLYNAGGESDTEVLVGDLTRLQNGN